ncbi:MAG: CPBP family intramembrane glutamic endopeptidase [Pseudomonadota bacterium]
MTENLSAPWQPAYRAWVGAGRKRVTLWRVLLGLVLVVALWIAASVIGLMIPMVVSVIQGDGQVTEILENMSDGLILSTVAPEVQSLLILLTFLGLWLGVWAAARLFHRRGIASVLTARGRWSWGHFWLGFGVAGGFSIAMMILSLATGMVALPTQFNLFAWGLWILPLFVAVFIQAGGEEVLFRGYIQQQMAARFRNPIAWLILPSLLFGVIHGGTDWQGLAYIAITGTIGIVTALTVWRTGSLAAAIGLHTGNNFAVFVVIGPEGLPNIVADPTAAREMLNAVTVAVDLGFYGLLALLLLSRWNPLKPVSRSPRGV